jgi:hypothetical protein
MSIRITFAALLASLILVPHAHAANGQWTTVASACVPDESSVGKYVADGAGVQFAFAQIGQIVLRCNVTAPADFGNNMDPVWTNMEVTYADADGMAAGSRVEVRLWRAGIGGITSFIPTAYFDSNVYAAGPTNTDPFFHVFDFTNTAYFLEIRLSRAAANLATRILRVRLW